MGAGRGVGRQVRLRATNHDGTPHFEHSAWLVIERRGLWVLQTFAGLEALREGDPWTSPYDTRGLYWDDRWYNVVRLELPRGGGLHGWYCNIATPAEFDGETLHYVDLQLDVIVHAGDSLDAEVRDEAEFLAAGERYTYPERVVTEARKAVEELLRLVRARAWPFDA
jgi:protein associated with RNAse G/E